MKKSNLYNLLVLIFLSFIIGACTNNSNSTPKKGSDMEQKIQALIDKMTIEEKAGEMTQLSLEAISKYDGENVSEPHQIDTAKLKKVILDYHVGSILNCAGHAYSKEHWYEIISKIQEYATQKSRLGIPVLYGIDAIHGVNYTTGSTLFPQQIAQAAMWNPQLIKKAARITAYETRASSIPWTFAPVLGLGRNPVWPRFWETFGEDVYLVSVCGKAMIEGFQGKELSSPYSVASCAKHYMGYSFPLSGNDRTPAWIPERQLREYFLPPFEVALKEAHSPTVMVNSTEINGSPVHTSKRILTHILHNELNFRGLAVSDWSDIHNLFQRSKVASSEKEAVRMAIDAGIDMSMVPLDFSFTNYLIELVKEGKIKESRLDESVRRILRVKFQLGLFDTPVTNPKEYPDFGSEKFAKVSLNAAREAITLLKNKKNILPLDKNKKLLVTGPTATSIRALQGGWSYTWQGQLSDSAYASEKSILEALQDEFGKDRIKYTKGSNFFKTQNIKEAVQKAKFVDYIVLCLGETSYTESEGNISDLYLPKAQVELAQAMIKTGKPVILVLAEGRPRLISQFVEGVDAVVDAFLPGPKGGIAVAEVLSGKLNPSGKLPFTYPKYPNHLVPYYHKYSEEHRSNLEGDIDPQFPFGFGLSYTNFEYKDLKLNKETFNAKDTLIATVTLKNTGIREGKEVVQLYVSDLVASISPDVKRLRAFTKVDLKKGEQKTIELKVPIKSLSFVGRDNKWILEDGDFTVQIDSLKQKFNLKQ